MDLSCFAGVHFLSLKKLASLTVQAVASPFVFGQLQIAIAAKNRPKREKLERSLREPTAMVSDHPYANTCLITGPFDMTFNIDNFRFLTIQNKHAFLQSLFYIRICSKSTNLNNVYSSVGHRWRESEYGSIHRFEMSKSTCWSLLTVLLRAEAELLDSTGRVVILWAILNTKLMQNELDTSVHNCNALCHILLTSNQQEFDTFSDKNWELVAEELSAFKDSSVFRHDLSFLANSEEDLDVAPNTAFDIGDWICFSSHESGDIEEHSQTKDLDIIEQIDTLQKEMDSSNSSNYTRFVTLKYATSNC